ncbi:MAG TPA: hypothetical protein V6C82_00725 [Chroococcales cyanobacterium]
MAASLSAGCNVFILSSETPKPKPSSQQVSQQQLPPPDFLNAKIEAFAGTGETGNGGSDDPMRCGLRGPSETAVLNDGSVFIADRGNSLIRLVKDGKISSFSLTLPAGKTLYTPRGLFLKGKDLFLSDVRRLYKVDAATGGLSWSNDIRDTYPQEEPEGIAVDSANNIYYSAPGNNAVRRWNASACKLEDFAQPGLKYPMGLAIDKNDFLYVADRSNHRICRIDKEGKISTLAGNGKNDQVASASVIANLGGFDGDGALATCQRLNQPTGVAVDKKGNIFIADSLNQRIRVVAPDGKIYTLAGTGVSGDTGDGGPAFQATFKTPIRVSLDPTEKFLYVTDDSAHRIRKITLNPQ